MEPEQKNEEACDQEQIKWEKINSLLSEGTANALKAFLSERTELSAELPPVSSSDESRNTETQEERSRSKYPKDPPNSVFKLKDYWEDRFVEEESYEWLVSWSKVRNLILPHLQKDSRILIVGCGNSSFSADIYDEGFENITNIDFSGVVIQKMSQLHKEKRPKMQWLEMDMTKLSFAEDSFDVVLDKAAMDALVVDEGDVWDPKEEVIQSVDAMCLNVSRVLTASGLFLQISFAQPHFRTKYLMGYRATQEECSPYESHRGWSQRYLWTLDFRSIPTIETGCLSVFLYDMQKSKPQH